jgi:hypothetical protein
MESQKTNPSMPPQGMPPQGMPPQGMPPQGMPPQGMPPQGMPPQGMPPQGMPPQGMQRQGMPHQGMPPQGMPPQGMPHQGMPPQGMQRQGMPPQGMPPQGMPPQGMPPQGMQRQNVNNKMSDDLSTLPTDKNNPSDVDKQLADTIFGEQLSFPQKLLKECKDMFILGLLFVVLSLPQLDQLIKKFVPMTNNSIYILILIKALVIMVLYWIINHFYLSRK